MSGGRAWLLLALGAVAAATLSGACAGNNPINVDKSPTPVQSPTPPTFSGGVKPALTTKGCTSTACHGSATSAQNGGVQMAGANWYQNLTATPGNDGVVVVNVNTAGASELLRKPDTNDPGLTHTGGKLWASSSGDAAFQTVLGWIENGAPNN